MWTFTKVLIQTIDIYSCPGKDFCNQSRIICHRYTEYLSKMIHSVSMCLFTKYLWSSYGYIGLLYCSIVLSPVHTQPSYMESIDQNIKTIDLLYLIIFRPNRLGPVLSELFKSGFRWQIQTLFDMDSINTSDTRVVVWNIQVQILLVELTFDLKKAPL